MKTPKEHIVIKNILITGNPGVGKTTLIRKIVSNLDAPAGGFYTLEVRDEDGKRWGFKIISLDGREAVLASVDTISNRRVSKYGVNVEAVDRIGVAALREALSRHKIVVIDEIGRMELVSNRFRDIALKAIESPKIVLGTIAMSDTNFAKKIKDRKDTKIIRLTRENFNELETHVERLIWKALNP